MKYFVKLVILIAFLFCGTGSAEPRFVLPSDLKEIRSGAFLGIEADMYVLSDSIKYIGEYAFAGEGTVLLPDSLEYIAPKAFGIGMTAIVNPGSYAHVYCLNNNVPHKTLLAEGTQKKVVFEYDGAVYKAAGSDNASVVSVEDDGVVSGMNQGRAIVCAASADDSIIEIRFDVIPYADMHHAMCVAHRGASGYYRENTINAFEYAHTLGADIAELDVHKSKDGVIFVFHDRTIRTEDGKKSVAKLTYRQLKKADKRICTLAEAIECIKKTDMRVMVEFKATGIVEETMAIVEAGGMAGRALYSGFDLDTLLKVKLLCPDACTAYSVNSLSLLEKIIESPEYYNVDIAGVNHKYLTKENVRDLHLAGKEVYAWTVNSKSRIAECIAMGVDGVLTNFLDYI